MSVLFLMELMEPPTDRGPLSVTVHQLQPTANGSLKHSQTKRLKGSQSLNTDSSLLLSLSLKDQDAGAEFKVPTGKKNDHTQTTQCDTLKYTLFV